MKDRAEALRVRGEMLRRAILELNREVEDLDRVGRQTKAAKAALPVVNERIILNRRHMFARLTNALQRRRARRPPSAASAGYGLTRPGRRS